MQWRIVAGAGARDAQRALVGRGRVAGCADASQILGARAEPAMQGEPTVVQGRSAVDHGHC